MSGVFGVSGLCVNRDFYAKKLHVTGFCSILRPTMTNDARNMPIDSRGP